MATASTMSHKQRLRAALAGEPVDRTPISLWWHDFEREWSAEGMADATVEAYRLYDWDLVKLNPRATYYMEAWGSRYEPTGTTQPRLVARALERYEDLADLPELDATGGVFAEQLEALRQVVARVGDEVDVIQTVFNPLTIAGGLVAMNPARLRTAAAADATTLHVGLSRIARTIAAYSAACLEAGASGIFYATVGWATREAADEDFYREFGRPYDLQVLGAVRGAPVNVLHVCRDQNMLDLLLDYPVALFNWDDRGAGNASLGDTAARTEAAVMGGVDRGLVQRGTVEEVSAQVRRDRAAAPATRLVLAGGCGIASDALAANIEAVVAAARG
jgi:uroporphyrinogen decarboxylase